MTPAQISSVRPAVTAESLHRTGLRNAMRARLVQRFCDRMPFDRILGPVFCDRIASVIYRNILDRPGKDARVGPSPEL